MFLSLDTAFVLKCLLQWNAVAAQVFKSSSEHITAHLQTKIFICIVVVLEIGNVSGKRFVSTYLLPRIIAY